jgi:hypothetical protein
MLTRTWVTGNFSHEHEDEFPKGKYTYTNLRGSVDGIMFAESGDYDTPADYDVDIVWKTCEIEFDVSCGECNGEGTAEGLDAMKFLENVSFDEYTIEWDEIDEEENSYD